MSTVKILIVDDELIIRESLSGWLERGGHRVSTAASGEQALEILKAGHFDVLLVDIKMDGISGHDVLRHVKEHYPDIDVIMITAFGSVHSAVEAMKAGAYDYLLKPFDPEAIEVLIERLIAEQSRKRENLYLREEFKERTRFESMIGQSRAMQEIFDLINDIRDSESTVLITGETGTGKGLAAKAIHTNSPVRDGPFVGVNCGAIPQNIMESELFGHQKGAFTDAKDTRKGRLEMACGGTLFLDEVGEISLRMQIDLLQLLEDKIFYRVGGTQPIEADFRVIAATNRDLNRAIEEKHFRRDLYYRLNVISIPIPPLRSRRDDIPLLAEHFLHKFVQETNRPIDRISRAAMDELMIYDWPGNVRELSNAVERAVVVCKTHTIAPEDLPISGSSSGSVTAGSLTLRAMEQAHIRQVLDDNAWNISRSAAVLGIDRSTLYSKIKKYRLGKRDGTHTA